MTTASPPQETKRSDQPEEAQLQRRPVATGFVPFEVSQGDARHHHDVQVLVAGLQRFNEFRELFPAYSSLVETLVSRKIGKANDKLRTVTLAGGTRFHVDSTDRFAALLCYGFLQEARDLNLFCRLVPPGACVVDVGANFGLYAIESGRIAGPDGNIHAFEPVPHQFALLQKNITMNGVNVEAHPKAVAAKTGEQRFYVTHSGSFSGFTDTGRSPVVDTLNVSCAALDDVASLKDTPVDLLKIDVEGAELEVLKGAAELIARSPEIVIMFEASYKNQTSASQREFVGWLLRQAELGYVLRTGFSDSEPGRVLETADAIGPSMTGNLFLVLGGSSAESGLKAAFQAELGAYEEAIKSLPDKSDLLDIVIPLYRSEIGQHQSYEKEIAALTTEALSVREQIAALTPEAQAVRGQIAALTAEAQAREEQLKEKLATERSEAKMREDWLRSDANAAQKKLEWAIEEYRVQLTRMRDDLRSLQTSTWWRCGTRYVFPLIDTLVKRRR